MNSDPTHHTPWTADAVPWQVRHADANPPAFCAWCGSRNVVAMCRCGDAALCSTCDSGKIFLGLLDRKCGECKRTTCPNCIRRCVPEKLTVCALCADAFQYQMSVDRAICDICARETGKTKVVGS